MDQSGLCKKSVKKVKMPGSKKTCPAVFVRKRAVELVENMLDFPGL